VGGEFERLQPPPAGADLGSAHGSVIAASACDAVLVNTAIAVAADPVEMARAFAQGTEAGRRAFLAGRAPELERAEASSPLTGFLDKLVTSQADAAMTEP
ncbi:MAG TPA: hypothetical protein VGB19_11710, partial [Actinomycetota bacterium]